MAELNGQVIDTAFAYEARHAQGLAESQELLQGLSDDADLINTFLDRLHKKTEDSNRATFDTGEELELLRKLSEIEGLETLFGGQNVWNGKESIEAFKRRLDEHVGGIHRKIELETNRVFLKQQELLQAFSMLQETLKSHKRLLDGIQANVRRM